MSSSRKELKVTYTITVVSVEGLPKKAEGCGIHVEWKGGRKDKETPMTPSVSLAEGKSSVEFAHKFEMTTTLEYTDIANRKFQEKNLVFSVVGEKIKKKKDAVIGKASVDLGTMAFPGSFQPRQALKLATKKEKDGAGTLNIVVNSKWAAKDGKKVVAGKKDKERSDKDKDKKDKDKDKKQKLDKRASKRDLKDKDKKDKDKDSKSDAGDEASGSESYSFAKKKGDALEESSFQVNGEDYHLESEAETSDGDDEPSMWGEAPDKTEDYLSDSDEESDKVEFKKDSSSADLTSSSASKDDKKKKEDEKKKEEEDKKKKEEADKKKKDEEDKKKKDEADKKKRDEEDKKKKEEDDKKKKEEADKKKKEEDEKKKKEEEDKKKKDEEDKDKRKSVRGFGALFGNKDKDAKDKDKDSKDKDSKDKDKDSKDKDKRDEKSDKDRSDRDKSDRDRSDRDRDRSDRDRDRSDRDKSDRDRDRSDRDRSDRDSKRDSKVLTSQPSSANLSGASKEEVDKLKAEFSKKEEKLQKEIAEKKEQITKLENELSVAKVQIQQDQDLKQWDRKPQDKQKAELKDLQETNRNLLVKNEQLEKDNKTMKTEQDSLKRQQKRLEEELSELKEELEAAKSKGSSSSKSSSNNKDSPANDRTEELNKKISSLQRKLDDQQDTNKKQQETIKQLESDLKKAQSAAASRPRDSNEEKVMGIVSSISKGQELDSLKDRINALQDEIDNFHHVEDWVYGAEFKYDGNGKNITATELANYITDHALLESDDLDKRDFLFHLLKATVRSYRRDINNIDRLSGWLAWMITLYNSLAKSSGAEKIDKKGLDMKFSSLPSMMSALHGRGGARRAKAERSDSDSDNESSSEEDENGVEGDIDSESLLGGLRSKLGLQERPAAFLAHLEGLVQHCYALIYSQICSELHEIKYMDILFDQSEVFHTSKKANESMSDSKKSNNGKQKANNRVKLTKVLNAAYRRLEAHHNNKTVVAQLFAQVFYFMANSVLNKFLTTPDLCRASRGYAVKVAYSHMEIWASEKSDLINHMRNQFDILLEACNVLVIDKSIFAAEDIVPTIFLKLNPKQIKQLLVSFQPDEMAPDPVPSAAKGAIERAALKVNKEIHLDSSTLINLTQ